MKKVLLSLSIVASVFAADKMLSQNKVLTMLKKTPLYSQIEPKLKNGLKIKGVEKKDFYIVTVYDKRGEGNFFLTKDLKYTILGTVFDNAKKTPIMADYPAEPFKGNRDIVENGIMFSFGSGKEDLYVVTDPECPFCRKFEKLAKSSHLSKRYKIHIIFLPLPFHKHSKDMIYYILSAKNDKERAKRFDETLRGDTKWASFSPTKEQKASINKELAKSKKAVDELGARGTPTFYDNNLKEIKNRGKLLK